MASHSVSIAFQTDKPITAYGPLAEAVFVLPALRYGSAPAGVTLGPEPRSDARS